MKYEDAVRIAKDFCATSELRKNLAAPRYDHGFVYASNGTVAVRIAVDHDEWTMGDEAERAAGLGKFPFERIDSLLNGGKVLAAGKFDAGRIEEIAKAFAAQLGEWRVREARIRDRERIEAEVVCPHCGETFYVEGGHVVDAKHFDVDDGNFDYRVAVKFGEGDDWDLFAFAKLLATIQACGAECEVEVLPERRESDVRASFVRMRSLDGEIHAIVIGLTRPALRVADAFGYGARDMLAISAAAAD